MVHQDAQPVAAVPCLEDHISADGGDGKAPGDRRIQDVALDRFPAVRVVLADPQPVRRALEEYLAARISQYASSDHSSRLGGRRHQFVVSPVWEGARRNWRATGSGQLGNRCLRKTAERDLY